MDKNSNAYTFIFAIAMVIVVGVALSFTATQLKPLQDENVRQEKMQNILSTFVGEKINVEGEEKELTRDVASEVYGEFVSEEISLDNKGNVKTDVDAFKVNLAKELSKPNDERTYPLYVANYGEDKFYIVPLRGSGLWGPIWGYIALKDDINTIKGVVFDHAGETAGLGAEITTDWFMERFTDEVIYDANGSLIGVAVVKGYSGGADKSDNAVDAISGATITGDGVSDMIQNILKNYEPYFKELKKSDKVAIR
ncbi:MAG: NADH:ubiquinone reductase (Na(+)-transporting) subunit C [Psychroflexus halocasei]